MEILSKGSQPSHNQNQRLENKPANVSCPAEPWSSVRIDMMGATKLNGPI